MDLRSHRWLHFPLWVNQHGSCGEIWQNHQQQSGLKRNCGNNRFKCITNGQNLEGGLFSRGFWPRVPSEDWESGFEAGIALNWNLPRWLPSSPGHVYHLRAKRTGSRLGFNELSSGCSLVASPRQLCRCIIHRKLCTFFFTSSWDNVRLSQHRRLRQPLMLSGNSFFRWWCRLWILAGFKNSCSISSTATASASMKTNHIKSSLYIRLQHMNYEPHWLPAALTEGHIKHTPSCCSTNENISVFTSQPGPTGSVHLGNGNHLETPSPLFHSFPLMSFQRKAGCGLCSYWFSFSRTNDDEKAERPVKWRIYMMGLELWIVGSAGTRAFIQVWLDQ